MSDMVSNLDFAKESKHVIDHDFDYLPLLDPYQGIIGMSPEEVLQMMGCGVFSYLLHGMREIEVCNYCKHNCKKDHPELSGVKTSENHHYSKIGNYTYRASPMWKGNECYVWVSVRFSSLQEECVNCIGRLLGFIKYLTHESLTFNKVEMNNITLEEARQHHGNTLYAIICCQKHFQVSISSEDLCQEIWSHPTNRCSYSASMNN